jgi:hypothetical protein
MHISPPVYGVLSKQQSIGDTWQHCRITPGLDNCSRPSPSIHVSDAKQFPFILSYLLIFLSVMFQQWYVYFLIYIFWLENLDMLLIPVPRISSSWRCYVWVNWLELRFYPVCMYFWPLPVLVFIISLFLPQSGYSAIHRHPIQTNHRGLLSKKSEKSGR